MYALKSEEYTLVSHITQDWRKDRKKKAGLPFPWHKKVTAPVETTPEETERDYYLSLLYAIREVPFIAFARDKGLRWQLLFCVEGQTVHETNFVKISYDLNKEDKSTDKFVIDFHDDYIELLVPYRKDKDFVKALQDRTNEDILDLDWENIPGVRRSIFRKRPAGKKIIYST